MQHQNNWQKTDTNNQSNFSALWLGLTSTATIYLGLSLLSSSIKIHALAWWIGLPLVISAVAVEYGTNRVLIIRISQAVLAFVLVITYGLLLWMTFAKGSTLYNQIMVDLLLFCAVTGVYLLSLGFHRYYVANSMPHGSVGKLNEHTGVVEPNYMLAKDQKQLKQNVSRWGRVSSFVPLFVGFSFLLIRLLPESGTTIVLSVAASIFFFFALFGFTSASLLIGSILSWERNNNLNIRVKRS
ncbi:MAG: hypothetical protein U0175_25800 [Caldilineaceae bacterium]